MFLPELTKQPPNSSTGGTNGGLARSDMHILQEASWKINVVGINNHELNGLPIVTTSVVVQTN